MMELENGYRVLALDDRANGLSEGPHDPDKYGSNMGQEIVNLFEHVGLERAPIVGYSMGGQIASKLRVDRPDVFITMTLDG